MLFGIFLALAACFIWGLIFVIPKMMFGFSAVEVAMGRYFCLGMVSILLMLCSRPLDYLRLPIKFWKTALLFSLIVNIGYYTSLVIALRYSSPSVIALMMGISPITISVFGNFVQKECSYRSLLFPALLITIGLIFVNIPAFDLSINQISPLKYLLGLLCGFASMAAWTWYVVMNAKFLRQHPDLPSGEWSTIIGVATLFWVILLGGIIFMVYADETTLLKYTTMSDELLLFLVGSLILGLMCSWLGSYLWNRVSHYLPVSFAGQLTIFETIFGLIFVFCIEQRIPAPLEIIGIMIMLAGIFRAFNAFNKSKVSLI